MTPHRLSPRARSAAALLLAAAAAFAPAVSATAEPDGGVAALLEEATRKARRRDLRGAVEALEKAIAADPARVEAHVRYQDLLREDPASLPVVQKRYEDDAAARPDDAVAQFLAARLLAPEAAAEAFRKQAERFPSSPWPSAGLGRALESARRYTEAAAAHAEAVRRAGETDALRFEAFRAYGLEQAGAWQQAAEAWETVVARAPQDLSARLGLAEAQRNAQQRDAALATLAEAAKVGASEPEVAYRRGLVLFDAGRWAEALESFDGAIRLDRGMLESACAAAEAAIHVAYQRAAAERRAPVAKDFDAALGYGERAITIEPRSPYAHFVLGAALEAAGEVDPEQLALAVKHYDLALDRLPVPGPDRVRVLTAKAWVHLLRGSWESALDAAQKAIDIDRRCVVAYGHAAHALTALGRTKEAVERCYQPALKVDPQNARLHHDLGLALWELKKPQDARRSLEHAKEYAPRNGQYRLALGQLYYELRKPREAAAELAQATELLPRSPDAWRAHGRACYAAKAWQDCARAYEKVVELDPEATREHALLAFVYLNQLQDPAKARAHAERFREKGGQDAALQDWLERLAAGTADK